MGAFYSLCATHSTIWCLAYCFLLHFTIYILYIYKNICMCIYKAIFSGKKHNMSFFSDVYLCDKEKYLKGSSRPN